MFVPFSNLPPHSRVWIYQSSRDLLASETEALEQKAKEFAEKWTAHKVALQASAKVFYNTFLVLGIDEQTAGASGCSIDSSVNFIRELEKEFGIGLLDRTQLAFLEHNTIKWVALQNMRAAVAEGRVTPEMQFFNNLVQTKAELENKWLLPAGQTWLIKYFGQPAIK